MRTLSLLWFAIVLCLYCCLAIWTDILTKHVNILLPFLSQSYCHFERVYQKLYEYYLLCRKQETELASQS